MRSGQKRLTEPQKMAIVASVAAGKTKSQVAEDFGLHRNSVKNLCRSVEMVAGSALSSSWREKLANTLPAKAVDAIEASIEDREDVHKAAATGIGIMKGLGHLAGDSATNVNVFLDKTRASIPADWARDYFSLDAAPAESDPPPTTSSNDALKSGGDDSQSW